MKEYKFEKDVWIIVKGDNPHSIFLKAGDSVTTINEVEIFEDENLWNSEKKKIGIVDVEPTSFSTDLKLKKSVLKVKEKKTNRIPR